MPGNTKLHGRASDGRWLPGHSGNLSGRPKTLAELTALARVEGIDSVRELAHLRDHAQSEQLQAWCADRLLDRGFGKPPQAVAVADVTRSKAPLTLGMSITELQQAYADSLKIVGKDSDYSFDLDPSEYRRQPQLTHSDQAEVIRQALVKPNGHAKPTAERIRRKAPTERIRRKPKL